MLPNTSSGIRTHEAYAVDLKSTPFDRSGILVITVLPGSDSWVRTSEAFAILQTTQRRWTPSFDHLDISPYRAPQIYIINTISITWLLLLFC